MTTDFEQSQEDDLRFAEWVDEQMNEAIEDFYLMLCHAFGVKALGELPPREKEVLFAKYPPVLPDGTIPGPSQDGKWDYQEISKEFGDKFRKEIVRPYARRLEEKLGS